MRDVDFLPEWYKDSTRRKSSVQRQYLALGIVFLIMIFSNSIATRKISSANADLARIDRERGQAERFMVEFGRLNSHVAEMRAVMASAKSLKLELDVANFLAELSAVVSGEIVLQSVGLLNSDPSGKGAADEAAPVTVDDRAGGQPPVGRFFVRLVGFAHHAGQVAALIDELDKSSLFNEVNLVYSKASVLTFPGTPAWESDEAGQKLLEFEIACALVTEYGTATDEN